MRKLATQSFILQKIIDYSKKNLKPESFKLPHDNVSKLKTCCQIWQHCGSLGHENFKGALINVGFKCRMKSLRAVLRFNKLTRKPAPPVEKPITHTDIVTLEQFTVQ